MAEILIKGLEMPKDDILRLEICPNGQVNRIIGWALSETKRGKAIEVTPHGRLIDVDKLLEEHPRISPKYPSETFYDNLDIFNMLDDAPTLIEASN